MHLILGGVLIGSKRNHVKNTSRKRLQKLINEQMNIDRLSILQGQANKTITGEFPEQKSYILFHVPTPKGNTRIPMENKNTIVNILPYLTPNLFSQLTPPPSSRHAYIPTIT